MYSYTGEIIIEVARCYILILVHTTENQNISTYPATKNYLLTIYELLQMNKGKGIWPGKDNWDFKWWNLMVGTSEEVSPENRLVNAVSIITLSAILIMLMVNLNLELWYVTTLNLVLAAFVSLCYYFSRFERKYRFSIVCCGALSYLTLIFNYHFNSGINGPTLFIFFLTFQLLITVTPKSQHLLWASLHIAVALALVYFENKFSDWAPLSYRNTGERNFDIVSTYIIVLIFIYFITSYLRDSYRKEKKLAEDCLHAIEEQNRKLENLSLEKDKLFSIISHDMRSPLSTIQGYLELITHSPNGDEEADVKKELLNLTKQTSDMLLNMLTWYKTQIDGVEVVKVPVNLNQVIGRVLEVQSSIATNKSIKISITVLHAAMAYTDENMVQVIIRNLVNNAIKFTPANGHIEIELSKTTDGKCIISIRDNGIGMSLKKQAQVFKLATGATYGTNREKGLGIGLALCKEYIDKLDGSINFISTENNGTEFIVTLPEYKVAHMLELPVMA